MTSVLDYRSTYRSAPLREEFCELRPTKGPSFEKFAEMVGSEFSLDDAITGMSEYTRVPLLCAQPYAMRDPDGTYVLRQCHLHRAVCATGRAGKGSKGLDHRGMISLSCHRFFEKSLPSDEGFVPRGATSIAAGPVGSITNCTTQPVHWDTESGDHYFSNEPPCPCCGMVLTNVLTCILAARPKSGNMSSFFNSLMKIRDSLSVHEEKCRLDAGVPAGHWTDCEHCREKIMFSDVNDACRGIYEVACHLIDRYGNDEEDVPVFQSTLDNVKQHNCRDAIRVQVPDCGGEDPGGFSCSVLEQVGPLAEIVEGFSSKGDNRMLRLLENTRLLFYNVDGTVQESLHEKGTLLTYPVKSNCCSTRGVTEKIKGDGINPLYVRSHVGEVGEVVRVSFHSRIEQVDGPAISHGTLMPEIVANFVVPTTSVALHDWTLRALKTFSTAPLLCSITQPEPAMARKMRISHRETQLASNGHVRDIITDLENRGGPQVRSVPLACLSSMSPELRSEYYKIARGYIRAISQDQTWVNGIIEDWLDDAKLTAEPGTSEEEMLRGFFKIISDSYLQCSGKFTDMDQFVTPLKMRIGDYRGIGEKNVRHSAVKWARWSRLSPSCKQSPRAGVGDRARESAPVNHPAPRQGNPKFARLRDSGNWR